MSAEGEKVRYPIFKDVRRYFCEYCGVCRSKKALIAAHIRDHHQDKMKDNEPNEDIGQRRLNICEECGASFQKPAHLKQHTQSHSVEIEVMKKNIFMIYCWA